jgi:ribosomal protein L11
MNLGVGTNAPNAKLEVKADASIGPEDAIFHVLNVSGDTIFAVYPEGVRINVIDDPAKSSGSKGGFAVGGFSPSKGASTNKYLHVSPDSVRIYIEDLPESKSSGSKGGFAVGGFSPSKVGQQYTLFTVNDDSAQVYIGDSTAGFGISNIQSGGGRVLNLTKGNYFIGHESGINSSVGKFNTFYGYEAGRSNFNGWENLFVGYFSGKSNVGGSRNVFLGRATGMKNVSGNENIFIGNASGINNNSNQNIFIGVEAGMKNETGYQNIFLGYKSGYNNLGGTGEQGSVNTFIGMQSGYSNSTGLANTFIGHKSGYTNTSGMFNTYIGRYAGENSIGDYNVFIGSEAGRFQSGSNKLCINATQSPVYQPPLIYGEFDNKRVVIAGDNANGKTFFVNGSAGGTSTWAQVSDGNYKKDVICIASPLEKVLKLRGVNFYWKDKSFGDGLQMGFIAQETEKIIPEVVEKYDGKYTMSYAPITALLVEAIKEQQKQIDSMHLIIEKLQIENFESKAEIKKFDELNKKVDELYKLLDLKAEK